MIEETPRVDIAIWSLDTISMADIRQHGTHFSFTEEGIQWIIDDLRRTADELEARIQS